MPAELRVACATDAAYAPYCAAMLHALLRQHPAGLTVHVLHDRELPAAVLDALRRVVESGGSRWSPVAAGTDVTSGLPRMARIPPIMWLRVLLPELLPQADRLLYLDVDTLALQPLDELWNTDLGGRLIGAVDNVLHESQSRRPQALGLPLDTRYFNSGVLLMDLHGLRREGISARLLDCARGRARELLWPDQDALNIVLGGSRAPLHPRWNCQNSFFYWGERSAEVLGRTALDEALASPAIVHFEGPAWGKPWHFLNDHPYRDAWLAAQRASGWPLPPAATLTRRFIGCLPRRLIRPLRRALGYPNPSHPRR